MKNEIRLSDLTEKQKGHVAWRLDHKSACGYLTACHIARGDEGNLRLIDIFENFGGMSKHAAKIHVRKVINYPNNWNWNTHNTR